MTRHVMAIFLALALSACASQRDVAYEAYLSGDHETALEGWRALAQRGDPVARYSLGLAYGNGTMGLRQDDEMAHILLSASARDEYVPAMLALGTLLFNSGSSENQEEAIEWYARAARWNNQNARELLSSMGYKAPEPDLYRRAAIEAEIRRLEGQQALAEGVRVFSCAMAGGANCDAERASRQPSYRSNPAGRSFSMCPDGSYVSGDCNLSPDGSYVGGRPSLSPDGTFVGGKPTLTPDGTFVGSDSGEYTMCPDGSFVGGSRCKMTPDGSFVGY